MSLKVGNTIPRRLYKGSSLVNRVYKGDTLQWERLTREGRSFVSPTDGEVSLDTIYGKSLVWNQMIPDAKIDVPIGTYNYASYVTFLTFTNGHKYLVALDNSELLVRMHITGTSYTSTAGQKILVTFTGTTGAGYAYQIQLGGGTSTKVSHIKMHDLTMMFGVGNEPSTVEEFEKLFPLPYYPYNSGTEMKASTINIDVKGFNLWDEEWESGAYNNGVKINSNSRIRCKNPIPCFPSTAYKETAIGEKSNTTFEIHFLDATGNYISKSIVTNQTFTTPDNCYSFVFCSATNYYGGIYNHDICINISNPTYNGQYKPYQQEKTVRIPLTTLTSNGEFIFTDGICGIGTARDEVGENKVIKRIGKVDLGTLDWAGEEVPAGEGHIRFSAACAGMAATNFVPNVLNAYGFYGDRRPITPTFVDKALAYYNGRIYLYDSTYTDATAFKTAMSGVYLYYELAEPIEYPLDTPFKVEYEIVEGGSESLVGLTAPIKEDIALNYKH